MLKMTLTSASKFPDWIFFTAVSIYSFLMPLLYSLYFLWFLIAIDYIGGVWLSKKNKKEIHWLKGFRTSISKMFAYTLISLAGYIIDIIFLKQALGQLVVFNIFMALLAIGEFRSIINNFGCILEIDIWNKVVKAFGKKGLSDLVTDEPIKE